MQAKNEKFIVIHSRQVAQEIIDAGQALKKWSRADIGGANLSLYLNDRILSMEFLPKVLDDLNRNTYPK
ncbi:hypothetical protein MPH48_07635 [Lysinibacillus fusiformis]|uniref:hypothetical protein n=1 Tax=Lysinibacillus fusiformis TaxID=28031 RepID=UPI001F4DEA21|nr:hypothetical protein [Lysinibacillus fusiformis]MCK1987981.1 hypothetical protein [Lysinibacillus fusiformis]